MSPAEDLAAAATRYYNLPPGYAKDQALATVKSKTAELVRAGGKGLAMDALRLVIPGWMAAGIVGVSAGALKVFGPKYLPPDIAKLLTGGVWVPDPVEGAPWISKSVEERLMSASRNVKGRYRAGLIEIIGPQGAGKTALGFRLAEAIGKWIAVLEYPQALVEQVNQQRAVREGVNATPLINVRWSIRGLDQLHHCTLVVSDASAFLNAYNYSDPVHIAFGNLIIWGAQRDVTTITDMHASTFVDRRMHALVRATYYKGAVNVEHGEIGERDELVDISRKARAALLTVPGSCAQAGCATVGQHQCRRATAYVRFSDDLQGLMRSQLPQTFRYSDAFSRAREYQSLAGFGRRGKENLEDDDVIEGEFTAEGL